MYNNDVLIMMESNGYKLFKLDRVAETDYSRPGITKGQLRFYHYHDIEVQGFISFQPGQNQFRLASNEFIYSYKFDLEKGGNNIPIHESTIVNFVNCTHMYFGNMGIRCIVYQLNQPNITVYFRKYNHNFRESIDDESKEGVDCQNLQSRNAFVVSDDDYLESFCAGCFSKHYKLQLPLIQSLTADKMEILTIKISRDESMIAVLVGKNLIKEQEELYQILVYEIHEKNNFVQFSNI
jgi:hypothetical protein